LLQNNNQSFSENIISRLETKLGSRTRVLDLGVIIGFLCVGIGLLLCVMEYAIGLVLFIIGFIIWTFTMLLFKSPISTQSFMFQYIISFIIPIAGFIIGGILLSDNNIQKRSAGTNCVGLGIISVIISGIITYMFIIK